MDLSNIKSKQFTVLPTPTPFSLILFCLSLIHMPAETEELSFQGVGNIYIQQKRLVLTNRNVNVILIFSFQNKIKNIY